MTFAMSAITEDTRNMKHTINITQDDHGILLEGKIEKDLKQAQLENQELDDWIYANYDVENEFDLRQVMLVLAF